MASLPFIDLQDSPIFRMRAAELETSADSLRNRTKKLVTGAQRYTSALEETFQESMRFADCVEAFCSGDDEESMAIGGPTIARFVQTLRELSSFVELLRTQVDLILCERLNQHSTQLATELRSARKNLTQRSSDYDAARSRHLGHRSLAQRATPWAANSKASTPERTQYAMSAARGAADDARYDLARKLVEVQGQHRFEFLECVASVMQAHLKYFEHGSAVVQTLAPYIDETLELADRLKGEAGRRREALEDLIKVEQATAAADDAAAAEVAIPSENVPTPPALGPLQMTAATTQLAWELEAFIRATAESGGSQITVLKQGYLLKQSSKMKSKWQRRFFVLDSTGVLYYYSAKGPEQRIGGGGGGGGFSVGGGGTAGRDQHPHTTVNLLTATVKPGVSADSLPIPFAFRVVSPAREYVLQAEDETEAKGWMEALQSVIACLLSGVIDVDVSRPLAVPSKPTHTRTASMEMSSLALHNNGGLPSPTSSDAPSSAAGSPHRAIAAMARALSPLLSSASPAQLIGAGSSIPGNAHCADCGAPGPDWGSLNLGTLHCIECSGFHRKLGVHVSKMRSLALDVRVWDPPVISLFQKLGNTAANAEWEALLTLPRPTSPGGEEWVWGEGSDEESSAPPRPALPVEAAQRAALRPGLPPKPNASSPSAAKEHFIEAKYQQRAYVLPSEDAAGGSEAATAALWDAVGAGDLRAAYRALVRGADVSSRPVSAQSTDLVLGTQALAGISEEEPGMPAPSTADATVLHAACKNADASLVELLLQWGAAVDWQDAFGRTPLMYCLIYDRPEIAKQLIRRGATCGLGDCNGRTAAQLLIGLGCTADADLLLLLGTSLA